MMLLPIREAIYLLTSIQKQVITTVLIISTLPKKVFPLYLQTVERILLARIVHMEKHLKRNTTTSITISHQIILTRQPGLEKEPSTIYNYCLPYELSIS